MKIINVVVMLHCVFMYEYACLDMCKGKVNLYIVILTQFLLIFQLSFTNVDSIKREMYEYCRKNGSPCCSGYKWDQDQAMCTRMLHYH